MQIWPKINRDFCCSSVEKFAVRWGSAQTDTDTDTDRHTDRQTQTKPAIRIRELNTTSLARVLLMRGPEKFGPIDESQSFRRFCAKADSLGSEINQTKLGHNLVAFGTFERIYAFEFYVHIFIDNCWRKHKGWPKFEPQLGIPSDASRLFGGFRGSNLAQALQRGL